MRLRKVLERNRQSFGRILINQNNAHQMDLSKNNSMLQTFNLSDVKQFNKYVSYTLENANAELGVGGYGENRPIYDHSEIFDGKTRRSTHLAVDLWVPVKTQILCPVDGTIHSFNNNEGIGDYGPTIILEHKIDGVKFHTLYGHLSLDSLENLKTGQKVKKGRVIGHVGYFPENGNWPSHLHFQIIEDLQGRTGDYPGVCNEEEREEYMRNCPDPNLILQIEELS